MTYASALGPYYWIFGVYEPILCLTGFLGAIADPKATHDGQAPWPNGIPPDGPLPTATLVTLIQLAHVCALVGIINAFVLTAVRRHLHNQPALQERIISSLLTPLLFGDFFHLFVTFWALGDAKWDIASYSPMLWTTIAIGLSLMIPRICWHLGFARYVDARGDGYIKSYHRKFDLANI